MIFTEDALEPVIILEEEKRAVWCDAATKLLITEYEQKSPYVGKNKRFSSYGKLWEHIASTMKSTGYNFSAQQLKQKWDALSRAYKVTVQNNKKTGQKRKVCPYQSELNNIFMKKRNVYPECVADGVQEIAPQYNTDTEITASENISPSTSTSTDTPKMRSIIRSPLKKLRDMLAEHHKERMEETKKYRIKKLEHKNLCEKNRHEERMKLLEIIRQRIEKS